MSVLGDMPKKTGGNFVYFSPQNVEITEEKCYNKEIKEQKENPIWHLI